MVELDMATNCMYKFQKFDQRERMKTNDKVIKACANKSESRYGHVHINVHNWT